jgi:hypothetical protein
MPVKVTCPHCQHEFTPPSKHHHMVNDLISLWNEYATKHKWQRVVKPGEALKKKLSSALKELPEIDQWKVVMRGLESDDFFSGRRSDYKTNIETLLFKSRYMNFYNAGVDAQERPTIDSILDEFRELLK